jgi:peptidoglycan/xylan/chitin deacetylase (PgdA/CDA1 family)
MPVHPLLLRPLLALGNLFYKNTPCAIALMYHDTAGAQNRYSVSMDVLQRQIADLIARGFRFVPAEDIALWKPDYGRVCALTFDDGYASNLELTHVRQPVTIFLTTAPDAQEVNTPLALDAQALADQLCTRLQVHFGAHGITHQKWTRLSPNMLEEELTGSKRTIEEWTDRKVSCCSYPKGAVNDLVRNAASAHFSSAFLADGAPITKPINDPMMIPRIAVFNDTSMDEFRLRTSPIFRYVLAVFRLWKRTQ